MIKYGSWVDGYKHLGTIGLIFDYYNVNSSGDYNYWHCKICFFELIN